MKKKVLALGALALGLLFATVTCATFISGKAYVDEAVPAIVGSWSSRELMDRASAELKREAPPEKIEVMFREMSAKLGRLKAYKGATGKARVGLWLQRGKVATGSYVAEAVFEKGSAKIEVNTIERDGSWQISGFHVRVEPPEPRPPVVHRSAPGGGEHDSTLR